jgi:putative MATE family efflux protein
VPGLRSTVLATADASDQNTVLDKDFMKIGVPALISLAAEPVSAIADAIFVARLGTVAQAALGLAVSAQFSVSKLYNDPLLKTSTSIVAGKEGPELEAAVASAVMTAAALGIIQSIVFLAFAPQILNLMGLTRNSEMMAPALSYLRWRSLGVPAATLVLVTNGIFRGRGDTKTPLYCTLFGTLLNVVLDPMFIFALNMGCAGAGAAVALAQWCSVIPLLYLLNRMVPIRIVGRDKVFFTSAVTSYFNAGALLLLRTLSKISVYSFTSAAAARLGPVVMAAYTITFNVAMAGSQLCEAISIASQSLIARNFPFNTPQRKEVARHIVARSVSVGWYTSAVLAVLSMVFQNQILATLTRSAEVSSAAAKVMPLVIFTQVLKGLGYATQGIVLGGQDWLWSSLGSQVAGVLSVGLLFALPKSLLNIWVALAVLMGTQVSAVTLESNLLCRYCRH